ncbi:MAG: LysR family transcriptional regulator [Lysobacterales bacterium]
MELSDLRAFMAVAQTENLPSAAARMHLTPSALSKTIRRLEQQLRMPLFDRVGRGLRLNAAGSRLRERAADLLRLETEICAEFVGVDSRFSCRIAAAPVLHWRFGVWTARWLVQHYPQADLVFQTGFDAQALAMLLGAEVDFALVTSAALEALPATVTAAPLGQISLHLASGRSHPLLEGASHVRVRTAQVLEHDFACPQRSWFAGIDRGSRSDGWRDDQLPRRIRYWIEDLQVLLALVRAGHALAYLPDFALDDPQLGRIEVSDCPYQCIESVWLLWRPSTAHGWQRQLADAMSQMLTPA